MGLIAEGILGGLRHQEPLCITFFDRDIVEEILGYFAAKPLAKVKSCLMDFVIMRHHAYVAIAGGRVKYGQVVGRHG
jgi:hypothetical protein